MTIKDHRARAVSNILMAKEMASNQLPLFYNVDIWTNTTSE